MEKIFALISLFSSDDCKEIIINQNVIDCGTIPKGVKMTKRSTSNSINNFLKVQYRKTMPSFKAKMQDVYCIVCVLSKYIFEKSKYVRNVFSAKKNYRHTLHSKLVSGQKIN